MTKEERKEFGERIFCEYIVRKRNSLLEKERTQTKSRERERKESLGSMEEVEERRGGERRKGEKKGEKRIKERMEKRKEEDGKRKKMLF